LLIVIIFHSKVVIYRGATSCSDRLGKKIEN